MAESDDAIDVTSCILATGGFDNQIRLWRVDNGSCHRTFPHPNSQINVLSITPDKTTIAAGGNPKISLYDTLAMGTGAREEFEGHQSNVTDLCFSADGSFLSTSSEDGTVKIWDHRASREHQRNFNHQASVTSVALHPSLPHVFSGDEQGRVVRWDLKANHCEEHLIPEPDVAIRHLATSPDGAHLVAVNNEGRCYIWDSSRSECQAKLKLDVHPSTYALSCVFSPDSRWLVTTGADQTVHIYDAHKDFRLHATLTGHTAWVWRAAFSGDSAYLVTVSSDKTGRLWDIRADQPETVLEFKGHQRAVTAVALNDV
ncbi:uncharacterized protein MONBRDRAFT_34029 [Monosiga brevicollis MX1]|uniref:Target of rapamycin complex subunit LST8 n=1 Tax=Monosiga brevicollis TaxID=81824 RepID=A9V9G5_MONBE|nr:uncharacterized protein MONBRDRAFT_34029 [Monosiga brevicollis MX1]EDQ85792.1 predicted protein [Monosiga brevicollis MX1]|eukprot:XP_001749271.1 hypothetical protein [Monosiga brevicollis MX1]